MLVVVGCDDLLAYVMQQSSSYVLQELLKPCLKHPFCRHCCWFRSASWSAAGRLGVHAPEVQGSCLQFAEAALYPRSSRGGNCSGFQTGGRLACAGAARFADAAGRFIIRRAHLPHLQGRSALASTITMDSDTPIPSTPQIHGMFSGMASPQASHLRAAHHAIPSAYEARAHALRPQNRHECTCVNASIA